MGAEFCEAWSSVSIKKSLQRVWLSKVCSKLDENSFPQLNEKLFSDTLYASKDYPCLQCGLHFIFVCDSLTPFSLTIQNESSLQVLMHRSIVEMKIEVILMSFSNIYFLKKIEFAHISVLFCLKDSGFSLNLL